MKKILLFVITATVFISCSKVKMPRIGETRSFGTITFTDVKDDPTTTTVGTKDNYKTLQVTTVQCAPFGGIMQTRIFSSNGFEGAEFRGMQLLINGTYDNFPLENPNVNITFYKGKEFTGYTSTAVVNVPVTFSKFEINVSAKDRKITASIPQLVIGSDTLSAFEIAIQSFGGSDYIADGYYMTFDVNGKACGSFETPLYNCEKPMWDEPGVNQIHGSFTPDDRNPIVDFKIDFVHHSSKLAYTGPVGKYDLNDGTGYTEIKMTATDQNGKIYTEQKGKGYVRTIFEKPWYRFFDGVSYNYREGFIVLEFEAELISSDGSILTIENGNAYYKTRWN